MTTLELITDIKQSMTDAGITPASRIALYGPITSTYAAIILAAWANKNCIVPLSTRLPIKRHIAILDQCSCTHLICTGDAPGLELEIPTVIINQPALEAIGSITFGDLSIDPTSSNEATIILTSGSTGAPKAVLHTIANHYFSALGASGIIDFSPGDGWLAAVPFYHVSGLGLLARMLLKGGTIVFPPVGMPLEESIALPGVSHLSLIPTQLIRLMRDSTLLPVLQKLKAILVGGAPTPTAIVQQAIEAYLPIHLTYGSTEMASQISTTLRLKPAMDFSASGKILPYREGMISRRGEILVRGKTLFRGYVSRAGLDRGVDKEGWFHTGDRGSLDITGNIAISGRLDTMFISGGENIFPEEIEEVILAVRGVNACVVVPVPDQEFGMRPFAFVNVHKALTSLAAIRTHLLTVLERFKCPDRIAAWPEEIDSGSKPDRAQFKKLAVEILGGIQERP